jgi:uncharacterized protein YcfL
VFFGQINEKTVVPVNFAACRCPIPLTPDTMKTAPTFFAAMIVWLLAGCQTEPESALPQDNTKYSIESTEKFVLMDRFTQAAITCTGLQEHLDASGRLEVVANVKNRQDQRVEVQVRCVFKDDNGFSVGNEAAWQNLALGEGATEAMYFTASTNLGHKYTIAVRQAR